MANNTAWAALVTRIPAADDLPLNTLVDLIEASNTDVKDRTGQEITSALTTTEQGQCRAAMALGHTQPCLKDTAGHNAGQAWACNHTASAEHIYRRHAHDVLTEITTNPFAYLRNHPRPGTSGERQGKP